MRFILGVVAGIVLIPILVLLYLASGFGPAAATDKPLPFETFIAGMALRQKMQREAPPPRDLSTMTTADLLAGADTYKKDCAVCHGLPDQPPAPIGDGMFPPAPQLMRAPPNRAPGPNAQGGQGPNGAAPRSGPGPGGPGMAGPGRAGGRGRGASGDYWRVKNGIRLTGMPSFGNTLTDDQIWPVVALIAARRNMPPEVKAALQPAPAAVPTAVAAPRTGKEQ
jgi:thiosulfate dehydrogenase